MNFSKKALLFLCVLSFSFPISLWALETSDFSLVPVVYDKKAKARDIIKETITVTNTSNRKLNLYPSVHDIDPTEGSEEFVAAQNGVERAESLANWIELSRGAVELGPGEEKSIPFVIRVNLNAVAGTYHSVISFSEGSTRSSAEESGPVATATVNLEVQADIKESLQLKKFFSDSIFFSGDDVLFNYQLENIGNQELLPKGEIRIYDRKGEEVAALNVNEDGKTFGPDQTTQLASVWSAASGFGKYKALLNVEYGKMQKASVQDTVFFWIIPWKQLLGLFLGSLVVIIFFALYFHRWLEQKHLHRLALAGAVDMELVPQTSGFFWGTKQADPKPVQQPVIEEEEEPAGTHVVDEPSTGKRGILSLLKWKMIVTSALSFRKKKGVVSPVAEDVEMKKEYHHPALREVLSNNSVEKQERQAVSAQLARESYSHSSSHQTINLKQMARNKVADAPVQDHIINLKKRT